MNNIPIDKLDKTFGRVKLHKYIGNIIQDHSTNPKPLGSVVYGNLSFPKQIKVADIGCGYGRCIDHLIDIIPTGSEYVGIDPQETNETHFLKNTKSAQFIGNYICGQADEISNFADDYFDLILCNYSLYFFIDKLSLITQKLSKDGLFITITHSSNSLNELLLDLQKVLRFESTPTWNELGSEQVLENFNGENGYNLLSPFFEDIEKIKYNNTLEFGNNDIDKLFDLLNFKKTTLIHHNDYEEFIKTKEFDKQMRNEVTQKIKKSAKYLLNKDDVIFRCCKSKN